MPLKKTKQMQFMDGLIGGNIRFVREIKKISREDLAKSLNCSLGTINRLEKGDCSYKNKKLYQISEILGVNVAYLTGFNIENYRTYWQD